MAHSIGSVSGIATNSLSNTSDEKISPSLGASIVCKSMRLKPSLASDFRMCTGPSAESDMTTSLMSQSRAWPYCMVYKVDIGEVFEFKLL